MKMISEGFLIMIKDSIFFDFGKVIICKEDVLFVKEILNFFVINLLRNIIISGYIDNMLIKNFEF